MAWPLLDKKQSSVSQWLEGQDGSGTPSLEGGEQDTSWEWGGWEREEMVNAAQTVFS